MASSSIISDSLLQTVTESGKAVAVEKRFNNRESFWQAYKRLYDEDNESRALQRAAWQGLVDCNPPLNSAKLKARGEAWRANFSTQQGRAIRSSNSAALWSLQFAGELLAEVSTKLYNSKTADVDALTEGCRKMARIYSNTLRSWPDYFNHEMATTNDIVTHGVGWYVWWDELDPRPTFVPHGAVKIPPRMRAMIEEMNVVYMEAPMPLSKLISLSENEKAQDMGWNRKAIIELLIRRYGKPSGEDRTVKYDVSTWESVQQEIKNNDMGRSFADMETVPVVYGFVESPDGKSVSVFITENTELTNKDADYLYERHEKRENMQQCCCPCFYDIGDGYFRSIKGVIGLVYPQLVVGNLSLCATADAAYLMGTVILENTGSNDMRLTKIGPVTQLPAGSKPMQTSFSPRIDGFLSLYELMSRLMNQNAGVYKRTPDYMDNRNKTAEEARIDAENEARLESFQAMLYYLHQDRKHSEIMRRLLSHNVPGWAGYEIAQDFKQQCIDAGVPQELLDPKNITVRAYRVIGAGSATAARRAMESVFGAMLRGVYDQQGAANIVRDFTAQQVGWEIVDRYSPAQNRDEVIGEEVSFATVENNDIRDGKQVQVGEGQDHYAHARTHIALLGMMQQAYTAGKRQQAQPIDPRQLWPAFASGMPHINAHLEAFAANEANRDKAKQLYDAFKQIDKFARELQGDVQRIMQLEQRAQQQAMEAQQQEAMQMDPTMRAEARKDATTQADIQRKDAVAAAEVQRKAAKAQVDMQTKIAKTAASIQAQQPPPAPELPPMRAIPSLEESGSM